MSFISRGTRAAARPLRQPRTNIRNPTRRNASSHDSHHEGGHGEGAHHVEAGGTGNEGFGKGFYVTLAAIPVFYLGYTLSGSTDNVIERFYQGYRSSITKKEQQDVLHTKALEQAISDRALLLSNKTNHSRDIRNTEMFNVGSPWNVAAGEGTADLNKLAQHYVEQREKMESARVEKMNARAKQ